MFKLAKPYVGPIVLILLEQGISMGGFKSEFFSGLLIGLAVFWFVMALFSNKALLKKFPRVLDWAPFLDPTGGFSTAEQLTGKFISGQTFNISLITHNGKIEGRTFEDCIIHGPAVLVISGVGHLHECMFDGPASFITTDAETVIGPIHILDTSFRKCRFVNVGFLGTKEIIDKFRQGTSYVAR